MLDGDQPAALAIARSLGRRGLAVDLGERTPRPLGSYSRYVRETITYPDPLERPGELIESLRRRLSTHAYELVIPVAEDTVHPIALHRDELEPLARLAVAPTAALETMLDKERTFALARSLGVPVPASWNVAGEAELEDLARSARYPVVVKPSRSISTEGPRVGAGGGGPRQKLRVTYAHDASQLLALGRAALIHGGVIVQEYFRGTGVGVELLADHGEVVYAFQHRRIHELPLTGGGSCLRESVPVDPRLLEHARRLVAASGWHGVAMVELKVDEATGEHRLMEVNGRFWGSLPLAVAAGADFPWFLYALEVEGRRPDAGPARLGVVSRKLSADVYWYVQVLKRDQDDPLIEWPTLPSAFAELLLAFSPRHHFDVQSLRDPAPGFADAWRTGEWLVERVIAMALDGRRGPR